MATIQDDTDITYGYALVNGKKSVYLPIIKTATGSTLSVVADTRKSMELFRNVIPREYRDKVKISFEFDESPTVLAAVESVATEGLIGAGLTGLMIFLFLRDLRSVIVVVAIIPLALLGSLVGLWLTGNTINIMSLGGMALSMGILVDMSTVTIENVHVQMGLTPKLATAVLRASNTTAVPILLALLCILSVFVPAFIMTDPLRSLFMPLTLAVGFAMISSYLLSIMCLPILCVYLLKPKAHGGEKRGLFDRMVDAYGHAVEWLVRLRWWVVPGYLAACGLILWVVGLRLGTELFPQVDSGEFVLRFRPPPGSNFELTRQMAVKCLEEIEGEAKTKNIKITMGFVGQVAPNFGIDNMVLFMRGPDDGQLRVALRDGQRHQARRVSRAAPQGPPRTRHPLAGEPAGTGRAVPRGGDAASQAVDLRIRAGRHRDPGHELRLADADRGPTHRHRPGRCPGACRKDRRQDEAHPLPPRRPVRADARLPLHRGRYRPREGGPQRRHGRGRAQGAHHGDVVDPFHRPQLLDRREYRLRLPGPGADTADKDGQGGRRRDLADRDGEPPGQPDGPRRGDGPSGCAARRVRPRHVAALPDPDRERRG